jgi:pimeloyl-ACP methyl ester carboxylesterase
MAPPNILFLPGLDGEGYCARKLVPHVRGASIEVFAYPTGARLDWPGLTATVVARMQDLGTRLLIGESFGGAVAQQVMLRRPDSLDAVLLISTFTHEAEPMAAAMGRLAARFLPRRLLRPVARRMADRKLAGTLEGDERRDFLDRFAELDHKEIARRLALLRRFDTRIDLAGVTLPVDVVFGTRDTIAGRRSQREAWEGLPGCVLHPFEGFGHLVAAEAAEQLGATISHWISRHDPRA